MVILRRMGLAVAVGIVPDEETDAEERAERRAEADALAVELAMEGVRWREPERGRVPATRAHVGSFSYSCLHTLRRVYALLDEGRPVTPAAADTAEDDAEVVESVSLMFESHLLNHSDCEGYYVPAEFDDPLFLPPDRVAGGGMVGSCQALLAELRICAPAIGIRLGPDGALSDAEADRVYELPEDDPFSTETMVWLTLHEQCIASIASGRALVFC
ncbi:hypothetical protein Aru02nite_30310 [Actinocatenispora rupis]|uniref:Uncharacterized protein n=2 Tax=Actinocatenispora rupis TaxID=519421 RepID=A0A8J3NCT5_9ACTN|nr:hypothetical protein Aru02nite_30310 [Actinocatenispora rupis]